jgi:hypothetical protein
VIASSTAPTSAVGGRSVATAMSDSENSRPSSAAQRSVSRVPLERKLRYSVIRDPSGAGMVWHELPSRCAWTPSSTIIDCASSVSTISLV